MLKIQLQLFLFLGDGNMYGLNEMGTDSLCMEISEEKIEENEFDQRRASFILRDIKWLYRELQNQFDK